MVAPEEEFRVVPLPLSICSNMIYGSHPAPQQNKGEQYRKSILIRFLQYEIRVGQYSVIWFKTASL